MDKVYENIFLYEKVLNNIDKSSYTLIVFKKEMLLVDNRLKMSAKTKCSSPYQIIIENPAVEVTVRLPGFVLLHSIF